MKLKHTPKVWRFWSGTVPLASLAPKSWRNTMWYAVVITFVPLLLLTFCWKVLTTYAVLERWSSTNFPHGWDTYAYGSCFRKQETGFKRKGAMIKEESPVHQMRWNRIIVKFHWFQLNQILTHSPARRSPQHQGTLYQYGKSSFRVEEWLSLVLVRDTPAESSWRTL